MNSPLILIAEDDVLTRQALVRILEQEGYRIAAAADGQEALTLYREEKPDILCLDVMMPNLDGYSVCEKVREEDKVTPVLFLTAKAEEMDKVVGLNLGADDYVAKPFGVQEVLARVRALLRRTGQTEKSDDHSLGANFTIADVVVEPDSLLARKPCGKEVKLSLRDTKILKLLFEKKGQVVTRDQLYDEVWGVNFFANSRSLDQHVSQLRKKIEADPAEPRLIETVHGVGYKYAE